MRSVRTLSILLLAVGSASAVEWFVATNGSNVTGDGSIGNPWKDIRYGVLNMAGGDTLTIRQGTYGRYLYQLAEFKSGTPTHPTVIQSYPGEVATYFPGYPDDYNCVQVAGVSNLVFNGLVIDGSSNSSCSIKLTGSGQGVPSSNILLTNCTIQNCGPGMGLLMTPANSGTEAMGAVVTHCRFINNGWNPAPLSNPLHQIYIQTSSNIIEYCYIQGPTNVGGGTLGIDHFGDDLWGCVYRNNFITNCSTGIGMLCRGTNNYVYNNIICNGYSWAVQVKGTTNCYVLNNTCYNNGGGIDVEGGCKNITIENNLCIGGNASVTTLDINGVDTASVQNNLAYGNYYGAGLRGTDYANRNGSVNVTTNGNLFQVEGEWGQFQTNAGNYDAKFVNAAGGDFHLSVGSDAIGRGKAQSVFYNDFSGLPRGTNAWTMGALEYLQFLATTVNILRVGNIRRP